MQVAVIGGGASGMMAAIAAAEAGAATVLYERNDRVGKKLLSTGNGKCNFSNRQLSADCYYVKDSEKLMHILHEFGTEQAVDFFEAAGMVVKEKNGGLYPFSEQASTVLDILRSQLRRQGVLVKTDAYVTKIERTKDQKFIVHTKTNTLIFDRVILSCGSMAAPKTGSDGNGYQLAQFLGHSLVPVVPALVQIKCRDDFIKAVAGVRQEACVKLLSNGKMLAKEKGEVQFTDYGISGIVTFQLSRLAAYALRKKEQVTVLLDFFPEYTDDLYDTLVTKRKANADSMSSLEEFFTGMLNKKLMLLLIRLAGMSAKEIYGQTKQEGIDRVFALCRSFTLTVSGVNSFEQAQVCAGGVPLSEITECLQSKLVKGLYLTGELLDVDGKCGGYNLQWAWASGYLAGRHAAEDSL